MALLSRRARKRRLRTAVAVVAVIVAAEVGAQLLAPALEPVPINWPNATTDLKHDQLELLAGSEVDGTDIPITFVGDTAAQQAFIPSTFAAIDVDARLSYNAAIPGGVPAVTRPWLLDEVIPRIESDIVVWGISMTDVTEGYGDAEFAAYQNSLGAKEGLLADVERAVVDVSALVRIRPALRDPSLLAGDRRDEIVQDMELSETLLGPGGQRLGYQPGPTDINAAEATRLLGDFTIDQGDLNAIADTITGIRRRGKQVVLVELPTSPQAIELLPDGAASLDDYRSALADLATATNTQVFRAVGPFTEDDFVDYVHLTEEAAESVTGQVAAALPTLELADAAAIFNDGSGLPRVIDQVDNDTLRTQLVALNNDLDAMDVSCNDPTRWMERALDVVDGMAQISATVERGETEDDIRFRSSALARQISSSIGGRTLLQSGCESGPVVGAPPALRDFETRTARLVAGYERLDGALSPPGPTPRSKLWMHSDQVFHLEGLRDDALAGEGVEVAFFGSAEARSGIDPTLFTELTGRTSANLGMNRATAEIAILWIRDAIEVARPDVIVWAISPSELIATCGLEVRRTFYTTPADVRAELFTNLSWKPPGSEFDRILGPADRSLYEIAPTYQRAFATFEPGSRGTLVGNTGTDQAALELESQTYGERVRQGLDCGERFNQMTDDVRSLVNSGVPVVIVGLPTSPALTELHPSGTDGVMALFNQNIQPLVSAGAEYIDLTDGFTTEDFSTSVQLTTEGRTKITERLADQLN
ncbi:MAG: hypothetical protein ACR2QE_03090 [Acidimicrobiales bacterium]